MWRGKVVTSQAAIPDLNEVELLKLPSTDRCLPYQSHFHALLYDLFEQLLKHLRFLKPSMPVFGEWSDAESPGRNPDQ
jgi:hypothetical protein